MTIRKKELWKVPAFCIAASWISFYVTVYLGQFFFVVTTLREDGGREVSIDPVRSLIFDVVLFAAVLLIGGLWAFRRMTRKEIAVSAGIAAAGYLLIVGVQLVVPGFPLEVSATLAYVQNWTGMLSSFLLKLTNQFELSVLLSCLAPLLFIPFGRKQV